MSDLEVLARRLAGTDSDPSIVVAAERRLRQLSPSDLVQRNIEIAVTAGEVLAPADVVAVIDNIPAVDSTIRLSPVDRPLLASSFRVVLDREEYSPELRADLVRTLIEEGTYETTKFVPHASRTVTERAFVAFMDQRHSVIDLKYQTYLDWAEAQDPGITSERAYQLAQQGGFVASEAMKSDALKPDQIESLYQQHNMMNQYLAVNVNCPEDLADRIADESAYFRKDWIAEASVSTSWLERHIDEELGKPLLDPGPLMGLLANRRTPTKALTDAFANDQVRHNVLLLPIIASHPNFPPTEADRLIETALDDPESISRWTADPYATIAQCAGHPELAPSLRQAVYRLPSADRWNSIVAATGDRVVDDGVNWIALQRLQPGPELAQVVRLDAPITPPSADPSVLRALAWLAENNVLRPVDWRSLESGPPQLAGWAASFKLAPAGVVAQHAAERLANETLRAVAMGAERPEVVGSWLDLPGRESIPRTIAAGVDKMRRTTYGNFRVEVLATDRSLATLSAAAQYDLGYYLSDSRDVRRFAARLANDDGRSYIGIFNVNGGRVSPEAAWNERLDGWSNAGDMEDGFVEHAPQDLIETMTYAAEAWNLNQYRQLGMDPLG